MENSNKIKIANCNYSNLILASRVMKSGALVEKKEDVTEDCINAVAEHIRSMGKNVEVFDKKTGELIFSLSVEFKKDYIPF